MINTLINTLIKYSDKYSIMKNNVYQESGVSVEKNERVVSSIKSLVESTHSEEMKNNPIFKLGNYSGVFPFPGNMPNNDFYLTATMDGVGTKSELVKESLSEEEIEDEVSVEAMEGEKMDTLMHGTQVNITETKNIWVKIKYKRRTGWICKFSLSKDNPLNQSVIANLEKINLKKHARKRASSYSTAATTRGLTEKDTTTVTKINYKSLKDMESFRPTTTELQDFKIKGELDQ